MDEREWMAERFEEQRPRLRAVAYRMLGSTNEADDAVQETWIRLSRSDTGAIANLEAWLVTVAGRVALNMLRARRTRREQPLEGRLADPIVDPVDRHRPRLAYVLHDMFAVPFEEIGAILDRSPDAARQLASRGRPRRRLRRPPRRARSRRRGAK